MLLKNQRLFAKFILKQSLCWLLYAGFVMRSEQMIRRFYDFAAEKPTFMVSVGYLGEVW